LPVLSATYMSTSVFMPSKYGGDIIQYTLCYLESNKLSYSPVFYLCYGQTIQYNSIKKKPSAPIRQSS
jgi:hypothetical protein